MTEFDPPAQTDRCEVQRLDPPAEAKAEPLSDLWYAGLVAEQHGADLKYVAPWDQWYYWNPTDGCWSADNTGEVIRRVAAVAKSIIPNAAQPFLDSDKEIRSFARRCQSKRAIEDVARLLRSHADIASAIDVWDRKRGALVVGNGTLDLRSGELGPSRREDFFTFRTTVTYDPSSASPVFDRFLERVLPDARDREYLRVACGYALLGLSTEHVVHFLWGSGANGKSTFLDVLRVVAGDYAATAPPRFLMAHKTEQHPTGLTVLRGRRIVISNETPENGRLDEDLVKLLSGGDMIKARGMRENFYEFSPTHSLFVATNHRPRVVGTDPAIWRRIRLVPFTETIPEGERDPGLKEKLIEEAPGILRWLASGARDYVPGLRAPDSVVVATNEYRESEDVLGEYLQERVVTVLGAFVSTADLFNDYLKWCADSGIPESRRLSKNQLSSKLADRGWKKKDTANVRGFADRTLTSRAGACA